MLEVYVDQISHRYHTHRSNYGLSNTCNWKGYKILFLQIRSHLSIYHEVTGIDWCLVFSIFLCSSTNVLNNVI